MQKVTYNQFYKTNVFGWQTKRAEVVRNCPRCVDCNRTNIRLEVHHVIPLNWGEEKVIYTNNPYKDLVDVKLEPLCHSCHMAREKGKDTLDIASLFVSGNLI